MQGSIIFEISRRTFVKWSAAVATLAALPLSKGLFASSPAASPAMTTLAAGRSEEHTSELQSLMRISYAVFCLKKKNIDNTILSGVIILIQNSLKRAVRNQLND